MNILALDAAFGPASAAVVLDDNRQFTVESEGSAPHSQSILPLLSRLLEQAGLEWLQLDGLAVGIGPGSFTGLRVACATLAGLNTALRRPVISVSSLAITARQAVVDGAVWVLEDARSGDAYAGCYAGNDRLHDDCCMDWTEVNQMPASDFVSHTPPPVDLPGWRRLDLAVSRSEALAACVRNAAGGSWPRKSQRYPLPAYLRASQAEVNLRGQ